MVKKAILVKKAKQLLEDEQMNWAHNAIVQIYQEQNIKNLESVKDVTKDDKLIVEAQKQRDAAVHNQQASLIKIEWLEKLIKEQSK